MAWKEQMVTVPIEADGIVLEGVWQSGSERGAVVAPPHPEYGGSLDNPVVNEIAYGLYQSGYASLRFNWRGVGASQGAISGDFADADRDFEAAVEHVAQTLDGPITAAGYSYGAAAALRAGLRDPRVRDLILVAPPVSMIKSLPIDQFRGPIHVVAGGHDDFAPLDELSSLLSGLPNASLDVIPDADHFFASAGLADLLQLVRNAAA